MVSSDNDKYVQIIQSTYQLSRYDVRCDMIDFFYNSQILDNFRS